MTQMRAVEVDFEVHKLIETTRTSFDESANDVLRRLLGIVGPSLQVVPSGKPYVFQNMEIPHGSEAKFTYNNVEYHARIENGFWITENGERHKSPSGAASALAVTKSGGKTKLDGWSYWLIKKPCETKWVGITPLWKLSEGKKIG